MSSSSQKNSHKLLKQNCFVKSYSNFSTLKRNQEVLRNDIPEVTMILKRWNYSSQ